MFNKALPTKILSYLIGIFTHQTYLVSKHFISSSERVITSSEGVKGSSERVITSSERVKGSSERVIVRNAEKGSISQTVKYYLQRFNLFGLGNQK